MFAANVLDSTGICRGTAEACLVTAAQMIVYTILHQYTPRKPRFHPMLVFIQRLMASGFLFPFSYTSRLDEVLVCKTAASSYTCDLNDVLV